MNTKIVLIAILACIGIVTPSLTNAEWATSPLYTMTQKITAAGELCPNCERIMVEGKTVCPDCYASAYYANEEIGNKEFTSTTPASHWITYQIFSLSNTKETDPSDVIVEIEYSGDSFSCSGTGFSDATPAQTLCPPNLLIKQVSIDFSAARMASNFVYSSNQALFFDSIDEAPTVANLSVDGTKDQYCPRDKYTVRFKVANLTSSYNPETNSYEQAVYAIGIPENQKAHLKIINIRVLDASEGDGTTCPVTLPSTVACSAYSSGDIVTFILEGDTIGLVAVPPEKTYPQIVGLYINSTLPLQFAAKNVDQVTVTVEFSNGASYAFPDNCNFVTVAGAPGDEWAQVRVRYRVKRFDINGKLIETRNVNEIVQKWNWTVSLPKRLENFVFNNRPPLLLIEPKNIPVYVVKPLVIGLHRGDTFTVTSDVYVDSDMKLFHDYIPVLEAFCKIPFFPCDPLPKVILAPRSWMYVSGALHIGEDVNIVIFQGSGSGIGRASTNAVLQGISITQGDLNRDGYTDSDDIQIIISWIKKKAPYNPLLDIDGDGKITVQDARKLTLLCSIATCQKP